jgi:uncharacterized protein YdhG (YjbR/CyaY superfamily)
MKSGKIPQNIDEYISGFPVEIQVKLISLRETIKKTAPEAVENISYQMPAFTLNGPLVYFAAFEKHIGFYPVPSGIEAFKEELSVYKQGKGSVQFPLDKPLPLKLVSEIVRFRVEENRIKAELKKKKK